MSFGGEDYLIFLQIDRAEIANGQQWKSYRHYLYNTEILGCKLSIHSCQFHLPMLREDHCWPKHRQQLQRQVFWFFFAAARNFNINISIKVACILAARSSMFSEMKSGFFASSFLKKYKIDVLIPLKE